MNHISISKSLIHLATKIAINPTYPALIKEFNLPNQKNLDEAYLNKIEGLAGKKNFTTHSLGPVGDSELVLLQPTKKNKGKHILIISGLHGNEPAPLFGLLRYLERVHDQTLDMVSLSLIPLLNPTGLRQNTRDNQWNEQTNRNYDNDKISREGQLLRDYLPTLKELGHDGILTMHEDPNAKACYIYMYHSKQAEKLAEIMLGVERMFFRQRPHQEEKEGPISHGIVWDHHEGSFEDWIHTEGISSVVTTETPGQVSFQERVLANTLLLNAFVDFHL